MPPVFVSVPHLTHGLLNAGGMTPPRYFFIRGRRCVLPTVVCLTVGIRVYVVTAASSCVGKYRVLGSTVNGLQLFPVLFDCLQNVCAFHYVSFSWLGEYC
jgi:hypothetical protein